MFLFFITIIACDKKLIFRNFYGICFDFDCNSSKLRNKFIKCSLNEKRIWMKEYNFKLINGIKKWSNDNNYKTKTK